MLKKEENGIDKILETKTNLKRTIEIYNINNKTIDLKRIKRSADDEEDAKINIKHEEGSRKVEIKKQKDSQDFIYLGQQLLHH